MICRPRPHQLASWLAHAVTIISNPQDYTATQIATAWAFLKQHRMLG